jgi:hypothetical protein
LPDHFDTAVITDIPLFKKRDLAQQFVKAVQKLNSPNGSTAFFDAVYALK